MDVCRRKGCGHSREGHPQHYLGGLHCSACECPHYLGQHSPRRVLAAASCSVAAATLTGVAWWRLTSGYDGPALVWLGGGAILLVVIGANIADRKGQ